MINGLEKIELVNGINFAISAFSLRGRNLKLRRELTIKLFFSLQFANKQGGK